MIEPLIGRCYTRARRIPLMIGRLPGSSEPLWGGPYTVTQVVVACAAATVLWLSHGLWAHFGTGWNGVVLLGIPVLLGWLVRRARVEGRDPLHAALGIGAFIAAPRRGRMADRPMRPRSGSTVRARRFFVEQGR